MPARRNLKRRQNHLRKLRLLDMSAMASRPIVVPPRCRYRDSIHPGDPCPDAQCRGKVNAQRDPGVWVRIQGQTPLAATVYELEKLRCNLCGNVYTATAPAEAGEKQYDASAAAR